MNQGQRQVLELSEEISGEYNDVWPIHTDSKVVTALERLCKEAVFGGSVVLQEWLETLPVLPTS